MVLLSKACIKKSHFWSCELTIVQLRIYPKNVPIIDLEIKQLNFFLLIHFIALLFSFRERVLKDTIHARFSFIWLAPSLSLSANRARMGHLSFTSLSVLQKTSLRLAYVCIYMQADGKVRDSNSNEGAMIEHLSFFG
jgi:hypothetical protein